MIRRLTAATLIVCLFVFTVHRVDAIHPSHAQSITFGMRIDTVTVGTSDIQIDVSTDKQIDAVGLIELRPHEESLKTFPPTDRISTRVDIQDPKCSIRLPRFAGERDRATSRWQALGMIQDEPVILSPTRFVTEVTDDAAGQLQALVPGGMKGVGDAPPGMSDDHTMFDLGIHHVTVNIVLTNLIRDGDAAPGWSEKPFEGRTFYINEGYMGSLEKTVGLLRRRNIIASAILLVGNKRDDEGRRISAMTHPSAEPEAHFAMPNLVQRQGSAMYAAIIDELAIRFSQPEPTSPRIDRWIMHNEVDQSGVWTNMGPASLDQYVETYLRSVRLVHDTTRRLNPNSRTYISLTHHWTDQSPYRHSFPARDVLDRFAEMAIETGDFDWGLAYHPYPRSLGQPKSWNDADVEDHFDTPFITPKNIEVLVDYLRQPSMRFDGRTRSLMLSEQGINELVEQEQSADVQAAGVVYLYARARQFPEIEAVHYHNYKDAPCEEGGLHLGLLDQDGERKLSWHAYAAMDGPEEPGAIEFAWPIIGVGGLDDLRPRPVAR